VKAEPLTLYLTLAAISTTIFIAIRRKATKNRNASSDRRRLKRIVKGFGFGFGFYTTLPQGACYKCDMRHI
jgi:hypothetical protein